MKATLHASECSDFPGVFNDGGGEEEGKRSLPRDKFPGEKGNWTKKSISKSSAGTPNFTEKGGSLNE